MRARALLLQLARHLGYYLELGAAAGREYRIACVRRAVLAVAGICGGIVGLGALWASGLVALWDTSWRLGYAFASALLILAAAGYALYRALAPPPSGPAAAVLKAEVGKDLELFHQWKSTILQ